MSMQRRHHIKIERAKKKQKMDYVKIFRSYVKSGRFKVKKESLMNHESKLVLFNHNFTALDDKAYHSDIFHACLYAFRFAYIKHVEPKKKENENPHPLDSIYERIEKKQKRDGIIFSGKVKKSDYDL